MVGSHTLCYVRLCEDIILKTACKSRMKTRQIPDEICLVMSRNECTEKMQMNCQEFSMQYIKKNLHRCLQMWWIETYHYRAFVLQHKINRHFYKIQTCDYVIKSGDQAVVFTIGTINDSGLKKTQLWFEKKKICWFMLKLF